MPGPADRAWAMKQGQKAKPKKPKILAMKKGAGPAIVKKESEPHANLNFTPANPRGFMIPVDKATVEKLMAEAEKNGKSIIWIGAEVAKAKKQ
jgi:hypothetical protein